MPRIQSAKKRLRQSIAATERNRAQRSKLRNAVKRVRAATTEAEAKAAYARAAQLLDRAGRKNLIHRNTASRVKSRLAKDVARKK